MKFIPISQVTSGSDSSLYDMQVASFPSDFIPDINLLTDTAM